MSGSPRAFDDGVPNGLNDHPSDDEEELCQFVGEARDLGGADGGRHRGGDGRFARARRLVSNLLLCDVLCANVYVMFLLSCIGAKRGHLMEVVEASAPPVVCMFIAAACKRRGDVPRVRVLPLDLALHIGSVDVRDAVREVRGVVSMGRRVTDEMVFLAFGRCVFRVTCR